MAKRDTALPAKSVRARSRDDTSLLLQSTESLGRLIAALQQQLDAAVARLQPRDAGSSKRARKGSKTTSKSASARKSAGARKGRARKTAKKIS